MKKRWLMKIPFVIGAVALAATAFSGLVMLLWNATITPIFHITAITLWQAAGLLVLSRILFSGFKGRRGMGGHYRKNMAFANWKNLTDEQKKQFRNKMHGCRGYAYAQEV